MWKYLLIVSVVVAVGIASSLGSNANTLANTLAPPTLNTSSLKRGTEQRPSAISPRPKKRSRHTSFSSKNDKLYINSAPSLEENDMNMSSPATSFLRAPSPAGRNPPLEILIPSGHTPVVLSEKTARSLLSAVSSLHDIEMGDRLASASPSREDHTQHSSPKNPSGQQPNMKLTDFEIIAPIKSLKWKKEILFACRYKGMGNYIAKVSFMHLMQEDEARAIVNDCLAWEHLASNDCTPKLLWMSRHGVEGSIIIRITRLPADGNLLERDIELTPRMLRDVLKLFEILHGAGILLGENTIKSENIVVDDDGKLKFNNFHYADVSRMGTPIPDDKTNTDYQSLALALDNGIVPLQTNANTVNMLNELWGMKTSGLNDFYRRDFFKVQTADAIKAVPEKNEYDDMMEEIIKKMGKAKIEQQQAQHKTSLGDYDFKAEKITDTRVQELVNKIGNFVDPTA